MITEELIDNKSCLFYASEYHLEMILLPYIKSRINNSKITIFTQNDLKDSVKTVLDRTNLEEKVKLKILELNWNKKNIEDLKNCIDKNEKNIIIINGTYDYIKEINRKIKETNKNKLSIVDCFCINDLNVDINLLSTKYDNILNTNKI